MARRACLLAVIAMALALFPRGLRAHDYGPYDLSVIVGGVPLAEYPHRGRVYVEALRGESFSLRISNPTRDRVAVALSVDGLNVVDAKRTTARKAAKWVLWPGQTVEIPGWQVSGESARRFFFTETARSYARWIGDTRNVGTIEAVFFRERRLPAVVSAAPPPDPEPLGSLPETADRSESDARSSGPSPAPSAGEEAAGALRRKESGRSLTDRPSKPADRFAATGIGERTRFPVRWIDFDEDPDPVARIGLRYEFRPELIRLGVLAGERELHARDRGRGFEREYAPEPDRHR